MSAAYRFVRDLRTRHVVLTVLAVAIATGAVSSAQSRTPSIRRGAPGAPRGPLTDVRINFAGSEYTAQVDASCKIDEKATTANTRAYFSVMYPWFGQRPPADQPQWRLNLEIRRSTSPDAYEQFVFSFADGARSGTIQTVAGSERMGSGRVRVTRHGMGARFEVEGRTPTGEPVTALINCSRFQTIEGAGG